MNAGVRSNLRRRLKVDAISHGRWDMRLTSNDIQEDALASSGSLPKHVVGTGLRAVRFSLASVLILFEPLARMALSTLALLLAGSAVFLKFSGAAPHLPFWEMLAAALMCAVALAMYGWLVRVLSSRR